MKQLLTILFFLISLIAVGQNAQKELKNYLENNSDLIEEGELIKLKEEDYKKQYIFYGFIHGSQRTQELDYQLFKSINKKSGVQYYAPEIDLSMAYYFNQYLKSGNNNLLLDLSKTYGKAVPQDASVAFFKKWQKLRVLNMELPAGKKIKVLGLDRMVSAKFYLRCLQEIIPEVDTSNYPLLSEIQKINRDEISDYELYEKDSELRKLLENNYVQLFENKKYETLFKENYNLFSDLIFQSSYFFAERRNREKRIEENFIRLISQGQMKDQQIYFNFGFAHVLQEDFLGFNYIAKRIKDQVSDEKVLTIFTALSESTVLWNAKFNKNGSYKGYGINWFGGEGDSIKERVNGINTLKKLTPRKSAVIYYVGDKEAIINQQLYFVYTKKQLKKRNPPKGTSAYFQYIIHVRNSKANIPAYQVIL